MKCFLWLLPFLLLAGAGMSTVIHVPADQPTIQAGLDAALDFDTVQLAPGEYSGDGNRDLDFKGKKIYLRGTGNSYGNDVWILVEASESDPHIAFWFHSQEDTFSVIDGISIVGSYKKFTDGSNLSYGAVQCDNSSPLVKNSQISGSAGYGIFATSNGYPRIRECLIRDNRVGIRAGRNRMFNGSNIEVSKCLIVNNDSAGVQLMYYANHLLENCTIVNNGVAGIQYELDMPKPQGSSTDPQVGRTQIVRSIVSNNGEYGIHGFIFGGYDLEIVCNDVFGHSVADFSGVKAGADDSLGNFSSDPLFCDPYYLQYTLRDNSPCLPGGNSCAALIGAFPAGCICCGTVTATGNINATGIIDLADLSLLIAYMTVGRVILPCPDAANIDGSGIIDLTDMSMLIAYLTVGASTGWMCPPE